MCVWERQRQLQQRRLVSAAAVQRRHAAGARRLLAPSHLRHIRTRTVTVVVAQNTVHTKLQFTHRINVTIQRSHCHLISQTTRKTFCYESNWKTDKRRVSVIGAGAGRGRGGSNEAFLLVAGYWASLPRYGVSQHWLIVKVPTTALVYNKVLL